MPGIPRDVAEHSLDIRAGARPVKQPLRRFDEEKCRAIGEEIHKLMAAGFIKEVFHPEWLANPVLVKKKGGKWRMCVHYTGLNKACSKVPYPLPRIDQIVDSTAGCETLSFLDAYSGYHQIRMKESDQLATSFITPFSMYCYITMPFGLRNAGATYQRCMNHVFGEHIGRTVEAYVQRPVYFINEVLSETKIRYPQIQKLLYAVILTRRKLRHYFESHPVTVVSSFPLGEII
jgi:hypothetical protein